MPTKRLATLLVVALQSCAVGTVAAALAVLSGYAAAGLAGSEPRVVETIGVHRNLGILTLTCFTVCSLWRARRPASFPERYRDVYWAIAAIGLAALVVTAYFGGILVFRLGVGYLPQA